MSSPLNAVCHPQLPTHLDIGVLDREGAEYVRRKCELTILPLGCRRMHSQLPIRLQWRVVNRVFAILSFH